jgi:hypothetical protein
LSYVTFVGSAGISCGAYNYGPDPGAEEAWCGYRSGYSRDYRTLFLLVQLTPAIPVLAGGVMAATGRSRLSVLAGLGVGVLVTILIWILEP